MCLGGVGVVEWGGGAVGDGDTPFGVPRGSGDPAPPPPPWSMARRPAPAFGAPPGPWGVGGPWPPGAARWSPKNPPSEAPASSGIGEGDFAPKGGCGDPPGVSTHTGPGRPPPMSNTRLIFSAPCWSSWSRTAAALPAPSLKTNSPSARSKETASWHTTRSAQSIPVRSTAVSPRLVTRVSIWNSFGPSDGSVTSLYLPSPIAQKGVASADRSAAPRGFRSKSPEHARKSRLADGKRMKSEATVTFALFRVASS